MPPLLVGASFETWFYRALVLLVVSCPCALVISTPVSIVSALAGAARRGVLVKGGVHLERLAGVRAIAFDKTGTLTRAALRVTAVLRRRRSHRGELLAAAAAVEVALGASDRGGDRRRSARARPDRSAAAGDVRALPGLGAEGRVDGALVVCGNVRLFRERGLLDAGGRTRR